MSNNSSSFSLPVFRTPPDPAAAVPKRQSLALKHASEGVCVARRHHITAKAKVETDKVRYKPTNGIWKHFEAGSEET